MPDMLQDALPQAAVASTLLIGCTFTGGDDFRVVYRTYAYLAKDPLLLVEDPLFIRSLT